MKHDRLFVKWSVFQHNSAASENILNMMSLPKNVSETSCFPRKLTICWGNIVSGGPLPLSSWGHSWDIWVNWIATKWPQFIHCFSFFRSCTTVNLFVGLVHDHGKFSENLKKRNFHLNLNQKDWMFSHRGKKVSNDKWQMSQQFTELLTHPGSEFYFLIISSSKSWCNINVLLLYGWGRMKAQNEEKAKKRWWGVSHSSKSTCQQVLANVLGNTVRQSSYRSLHYIHHHHNVSATSTRVLKKCQFLSYIDGLFQVHNLYW